MKRIIEALGAISSPDLSLAGDRPETIALKQRYWRSTLPTLPTMAFFGTLFWFLDVRTIAVGMWIFGGFNLLLLLAFFSVRRYIKAFVLITLCLGVLFSFCAVLFFGGIIHSGGIVLVGLAYCIMSLSHLEPRQSRILFSIYLVSVILAALLQPVLTPRPEITPNINLLLFVLHLLVIAGAVFQILSFYLEQNIRIQQAEADQLRALDLMKSQFYTNISHEFRTPLTVILGMAQQIEDEPDDSLKTGLKLIRRNGLQLLHLVNQMLDLSKLEAGAMRMHPFQSDIISYLRYLTEPYSRVAERKAIRFSFLSDMDTLQMDFDSEMILSLVGNLLSNAIKYSGEGSEVRLHVSTSMTIPARSREVFSLFPERGSEEGGKCLVLRIHDSGPGIPPDRIPYIFDRFYRMEDHLVDDQCTGETHGTGIGLSLVRELIRIMNGDLHVRSVQSQGTEFTVYLPITNTAPEQPPGSTYMWLAEADLNIDIEEVEEDSLAVASDLPLLLLIEDNPDVIQYEYTILKDLYRIELAANGKEGIEKALTQVPDLILSDVMMPEVDGYQVCQTLKSDFRTSHIPIVLLTAKADVDSKIAGLEFGADAYLAKPFNPKELKVRLQNLLESRVKLREKYRAMTLAPDQYDVPVNPDAIFLSEMKEAIQNHLDDEDFNALELSRILGMSRVQLYRKLKSLIGQSASQCIRTYRMHAARDLIKTTGMNISEIAFEVGFRDPAYFSRAFTREFGSAPSTLRAQGHA